MILLDSQRQKVSYDKKTERQLANEKADRIMNGVAYWGSFYRCNPHRFAKEYLNVQLKLFQKILLYAMMVNNFFMYCAARGQGKTYLVALFCVIRAILYPKSKIVVCSSTRIQGNETLLKITEDFMKNYGWGSENLRREILNSTVGANRAIIEFRNGSWIKVVTASDSGRGSRANILVIDEFRMVDKDTIDTVLKRFLTAPRQPNYLNEREYKHLLERNIEIYMSSAWYKSHWSYSKAKSYTFNMLSDKKYFICGLPYQLSIMEGLLSKEQLEDEMSEADFNETTFSIEMECLWFGDDEGSFFKFDEISKQRKLKTALYNPRYMVGSKTVIPDLELNERRILSVDIALMASTNKKKNDASSIIINRAIPTRDNRYISNVIYLENQEGLVTGDLALIVRRLYEQFKCTDLVVDTNGQGLGVYDELIKDIYDTETGETYVALTCRNDKNMADRCKVEEALPVIWSIKASASFNTEMCLALRNGFSSGKINLLVSDIEADEIIRTTVKNYNKLTPYEKLMYKMPYVQTTLLVYELVKLDSEVRGTNIKISERSDARKDRYSSIGMNYWVQCQLEREFLQKRKSSFNAHEYATRFRNLNKRPKIY